MAQRPVRENATHVSVPWWSQPQPPQPDFEPRVPLGDAIEKVAKPVARAIKTVTRGKVDLTECGGCRRRREATNRLFGKRRKRRGMV